MEATDSDGAAHSSPHPSMNTSTSRDRLWRKRLNELSAVWPDFVTAIPAGCTKRASPRAAFARRCRSSARSGAGSKVKKLGKKMRRDDAVPWSDPRARRRARPLENKSKTEGVPGRRTGNGAARGRVAAAGAARRARRPRSGRGSEEAAQEARESRESGKREEGRGKKGRQQRAEDKFEAQWRGVLAARLMRRAKSVATALDECRTAVCARTPSRRAHLDEEAPLRAGNRTRSGSGRGAAARQSPQAPSGTAGPPARSADAAEARARSGSVAGGRVATERSDGVCRFARPRMPPLHADFVEHRAELRQRWFDKTSVIRSCPRSTHSASAPGARRRRPGTRPRRPSPGA